jgi:hypothetical protein
MEVLYFNSTTVVCDLIKYIFPSRINLSVGNRKMSLRDIEMGSMKVVVVVGGHNSSATFGHKFLHSQSRQTLSFFL